jgi:hypothetical protein
MHLGMNSLVLENSKSWKTLKIVINSLVLTWLVLEKY